MLTASHPAKALPGSVRSAHQQQSWIAALISFHIAEAVLTLPCRQYEATDGLHVVIWRGYRNLIADFLTTCWPEDEPLEIIIAPNVTFAPPKAAEFVLQLCVAPSADQEITSELASRFEQQAQRFGYRLARFWYVWWVTYHGIRLVAAGTLRIFAAIGAAKVSGKFLN